MKLFSKPSPSTLTTIKLDIKDKGKIAWTTTVYYYVAMLLSLVVFFAGTNLATHGLLRTLSPNMAANATCLPPSTSKFIDPMHISDEEQFCRSAEHDRQIRQGSFQLAQGSTMALIACLVFGWHFRRIRGLELQLR